MLQDSNKFKLQVVKNKFKRSKKSEKKIKGFFDKTVHKINKLRRKGNQTQNYLQDRPQMTTTANENNTQKIPITNRKFNTQEKMRFKNHRTPAWIKDMKFEKDVFR